MITSKKDFKSYLVADRLANSKPLNSSASGNIKQFIFPDHVWAFIFLLRRLEYTKNCYNGIIGKILYLWYYRKFRRLSFKLGFSIPLNVFGPGLSIPHYGTIIVNPAAKVGRNCRLHACVNIGASGGSNIAPRVGDNVYIGPGAILFGDITIADNISIAANATVNKSIEIKNVTVGGTPAKILKENSRVWWVMNKLNLQDFN